MGLPAHVVVVGIGADGWDGLDPARRAAVEQADVVLGGERHLAMLPEDLAAERRPWPSPLREGLPALLDDLAGGVVALASGDPLVSGVGTTLVDLLGPDAVTVLPGISSVALACARMRWSAEGLAVVRDHRHVVAHLRPGARVLVLSADASTPAALARVLADAGHGASAMTVLAHLGGPEEDLRRGMAASWGDPEVPALNVVAVEVAGSGGRVLPSTPGLPDDAFEHDGQLTKRDVRASALARLEPGPGRLLWDVGAGAGSVGIEWMRHHSSARTVAVEARAERAERVARNAELLGVPELQVVHGSAPEALAGLPRPDAVFVGGGATGEGVMTACWSALPPGGRLVAHGVTLETESLLVAWHAQHGGELTRLQVEHAEAIGSFRGWTPARAVVQWAATKEADA